MFWPVANGDPGVLTVIELLCPLYVAVTVTAEFPNELTLYAPLASVEADPPGEAVTVAP